MENKTTSIPRTIHQIWGGADPIHERLAVYMAQNAAYCHDNEFKHVFWRLINNDELIVREGVDNYSIKNITELFDDARIPEMLADPNLHRVMKSDILRFNILYKYGGFYADLDLVILASLEKYLGLEYVCGFEKPRRVVCTAFLGAPVGSPVNKAVSDFILSAYEKMKAANQYPKNLWDVLKFTGPDMLTEILRGFPSVKPFSPEVFYPWPAPVINRPYTVHYFAGAKKGGWTFDGCKDKDCTTCNDRKNCNIIKEKI
jgi:mannosyltransferase OCH1-like enzyme